MNADRQTASISARSVKAAMVEALGQKRLEGGGPRDRLEALIIARDEHLCDEVGLTDGACLGHFASREACPIAAAKHRAP
jgi:hypothetical protein